MMDYLYFFVINTIDNVKVVDLNLTAMSCVEIHFRSEVWNITCFAIYRSPNGIVNDYFVELRNNILVKAANRNSYYSISVGDINIHIILNCNDLFYNYLQLVNNYGYVSTMNCNTRLSL